MKTSLLFGIHMHQPVDNFGWVIEQAIVSCYEPFFEVMSRYPAFKFSVHCSGWLMEQIQTLRPSLYEKIQTLSQQGSIEFFSAGYYEPILSVIPSRDRRGQIERMNRSIEERFSQKPQGLWLTERVWESSLIPDLAATKIRYTLMDDYHFQCAGFDADVLDGYYMSEEGGEKIALFPISQKLRYAIPFLRVESAMRSIKSFCRENDSAAIIFDDAEKFGMWPGTYEWVYEKGWLETFVCSVLDDETIEMLHFQEYYNTRRPRGIAYLPNVSYYEMGEWSLRADDALRLQSLKEEMTEEVFHRYGVKFLKGGIWKNFLVKYPESNRLHKRMIELSNALFDEGGDYTTELYKLQTNDPLWHGVFGGLYLPNLRDNSYRYLIECENIRDSKSSVIVRDSNEMDGYPKYKSLTPRLITRFDSFGGQLVELDIRDRCFNYQNTLTRRKEAYHQQLFESPREKKSVSEEGIDTIHHASARFDDSLKEAVIYDWYLKNSFVDHISDASFSLEQFRRCSFREYGDFANQPFESVLNDTGIDFSRHGGIYNHLRYATTLAKRFRCGDTEIQFSILLESESPKSYCYVMEHNFHFSDYESLQINTASCEAMGEFRNIDRVELYDTIMNKKITLTFDQPCDVFYFRLQTLSQSEQGFDLSVQGLSLAFLFPFQKSLEITGRLEITDV